MFSLRRFTTAYSEKPNGKESRKIKKKRYENKRRKIRIFGDSGLLVRTVQLKDLDKNFNDIEDDVITAVEKSKAQQYYGPLRKWSIGHSELPPFFYKMETEGALARFLAILVEPALVDWSRYIHISTTDLSSSYSVKVDTTCLEASQACSAMQS